MVSKENAPVYEDQQILGYKPIWSPDGKYLSSFDGFSNEIHLLNLVTSEQLIFKSNKGNLVTWSADSSTFVYTDIEEADFGPRTQILARDLVANQTSTMFGEKDDRDYYYNSLAWSPAEDALVIGLRFEENNPAEALWLMDPASHDIQVIASDPDYVYSTPYWGPWGTALVFQQFKLKRGYKPEIGMWKPGLDEPVILTEGIMPRWLP
jgi:WD40 repeat protein